MLYLLSSWSLWIWNSASAPRLYCHLSWFARTAGVAKQWTQLGLLTKVPTSSCLLGSVGARQPRGSGASYWQLTAISWHQKLPWHFKIQPRYLACFLSNKKLCSLPGRLQKSVIAHESNAWRRSDPMEGQNYLIWSMCALKASRFRFWVSNCAWLIMTLG